MIDDIRRAIYDELRWLASLHTVSLEGGAVPSFKTSGQMRAMLRIEIDHPRLPELLREVDGIHNPVWDQLRGRASAFGPPTFEGVPLFEVGKLPDPGWRVVNVIRSLQ